MELVLIEPDTVYWSPDKIIVVFNLPTGMPLNEMPNLELKTASAAFDGAVAAIRAVTSEAVAMKTLKTVMNNLWLGRYVGDNCEAFCLYLGGVQVSIIV